MAEVNAKDLTTKTAPASTDSMLLFGTTTNEGAKITVDNLANNILERLATKTFPNQVGGSSAATILAQLATLNSNWTSWTTLQPHEDVASKLTSHDMGYLIIGKLYIVSIKFVPSETIQGSNYVTTLTKSANAGTVAHPYSNEAIDATKLIYSASGSTNIGIKGTFAAGKSYSACLVYKTN